MLDPGSYRWAYAFLTAAGRPARTTLAQRALHQSGEISEADEANAQDVNAGYERIAPNSSQRRRGIQRRVGQ